MNLAKCIYVSMRHLFDGGWQVGLKPAVNYVSSLWDL